jgi:hypothetical protein
MVVLRDYNEDMRAFAHRDADGIWHLDKMEKRIWERWDTFSHHAEPTFRARIHREVESKRNKRDVFWPSWSHVVGHHVALYLERVGEA